MLFFLSCGLASRMASLVVAATLVPWNGLLAAVDLTGEFCSLHGSDCSCRVMCQRNKARHAEERPAAAACHRNGDDEITERRSCATTRCERADTVFLGNSDQFYLAEGRFSLRRETGALSFFALEKTPPLAWAHGPPLPPPRI